MCSDNNHVLVEDSGGIYYCLHCSELFCLVVRDGESLYVSVDKIFYFGKKKRR